ncbi:hypothetical protein BGV71_04035 [Burkholderia ubonensis]|nr:hypothetical protein BGV71_04035 [Burkholderia ubonensis]
MSSTPDDSSIADTPAAAVTPQQSEPDITPAAIARPGVRPWLSDTFAIDRLAGPGVAVPIR